MKLTCGLQVVRWPSSFCFGLRFLAPTRATCSFEFAVPSERQVTAGHWAPGSCRLRVYDLHRVPQRVHCGSNSPPPKLPLLPSTWPEPCFSTSRPSVAQLRELYSFPSSQEEQRLPLLLQMHSVEGTLPRGCSARGMKRKPWNAESMELPVAWVLLGSMAPAILWILVVAAQGRGPLLGRPCQRLCVVAIASGQQGSLSLWGLGDVRPCCHQVLD